MIAVVQRVSEASVTIEDKIHNKIGRGFLVLLGIRKGDTVTTLKTLAKKVIDLRIFPDENDKMNLSLKDVDGEVLVISQFTLCSDIEKSGNRPSFIFAEEPEKASALYEKFIDELREYYKSDKVFGGVFAAYMKIKLENDGPVTIILERN
ncbi:MAG: D-tyrosyl-tRNA(Tyr) deacylase [Ignavibacteria bacterium]|nr:D-tyrosyl-tRNA(Tyr) deacylase [Ignavibacteria bacterium]